LVKEGDDMDWFIDRGMGPSFDGAYEVIGYGVAAVLQHLGEADAKEAAECAAAYEGEIVVYRQ